MTMMTRGGASKSGMPSSGHIHLSIISFDSQENRSHTIILFIPLGCVKGLFSSVALLELKY